MTPSPNMAARFGSLSSSRMSVALLDSRSSLSCLRISTRTVQQGRRSFWWGRAGRKTSGPAGQGQPYIDAYKRVIKQRHLKNLQHGPKVWDAGKFVALYYSRFGDGHREASSWGKPPRKEALSDGIRNRDSTDKKNSSERSEEGFMDSLQKQLGASEQVFQDTMEKKLEAVRKMIEKDPFNAVFGSAASRAWYPWRQGESHIYPRESTTDSLQKDSPTSSSTSASDPSIQYINSSSSSAPGTSNSASAPSSQQAAEEDYYIDPITMKRVTRSSITRTVQNPAIAFENGSSILEKPSASFPSNEAVDIPVKRFVEPVRMSDLGKEEIEALTSGSKPQQAAKDSEHQSPMTQSNLNNLEVKRTDISQLTQPASNQVPESETPNMIEGDLDKAHVRSPLEPVDRSASSKLESSLDRHVQRKQVNSINLPNIAPRPAHEQVSLQSTKLEYNPTENRTEDIDLLTANDVRAAAGKIKRKKITESPEEVTKRRAGIEKTWAQRTASIEEEFLKEIIEATHRRAEDLEKFAKQKFMSGAPHSEVLAMLSENSIRGPFKNLFDKSGAASKVMSQYPDLTTLSRHLQTKMVESMLEAGQKKLEFFNQDYRQIRHNLIQASLCREIDQVKSAMEAHEARLRRVLVTDSKIASPSSRAQLGAEVSGKDDERLNEKNKARQLVKEIRDIYEDTYGAITTKHRQPGYQAEEIKLLSGPPSTPHTDDAIQAGKLKARGPVDPAAKVEKPQPQLYRVIALDESSREISVMNTTSSRFENDSRPRSVPGILTHLNSPTKFFDHMEAAEASGFELVAGTRWMLVYKKTGEAVPEMNVIKMQRQISRYLALCRRRAEEMPPSAVKKVLKWTLEKDWAKLLTNEDSGVQKRTKNSELSTPKSNTVPDTTDTTPNVLEPVEAVSKTLNVSSTLEGTDVDPSVRKTPAVNASTTKEIVSETEESQQVQSPATNPETISQSSPTSQSPAVHREEAVFSGQPLHERLLTEVQWQDLEQQRRKTYENFRNRVRNQRISERQSRGHRRSTGVAGAVATRSTLGSGRASRTRAWLRIRRLGRLLKKIAQFTVLGAVSFYLLGVWAEWERRRRSQMLLEEMQGSGSIMSSGMNPSAAKSPARKLEGWDTQNWTSSFLGPSSTPGAGNRNEVLLGRDGLAREKYKKEVEGESGWSSLSKDAPKWYNNRHRWWWMDSC